MKVLIGTNILTRSVQPGHPMHSDAVNAVALLRAAGEELLVVPSEPDRVLGQWLPGHSM